MEAISLIFLALIETLPISLVVGTSFCYIMKGFIKFDGVPWWKVFVITWAINGIILLLIKPEMATALSVYKIIFLSSFILGIAGVIKFYKRKKV